MKKYFILIFLAIVNFTSAHDIGVTEAGFQELPDGKYRLTVDTPGKEGEVVPPPHLPDKCQLLDIQERSGLQPVMTFSCGTEGLSSSDTLVLTWRREAVLIHAQWLNGKEIRALFLREGEVINVPLSELAAASASVSKLAKRYTMLGFEHILEGIDHLLFVLGIMLLVNNVKTLLKAITAFTVAHSITLALSFLGLLALPSTPVEASIAFSIVILAYEVIRAEKGERGLTANYPWLVAGGFGLLHGLGFAGALSSLGVPSTEIPIALLCFNIGVEIGQIVFVASVLLAVFIANQVLKRFVGDYVIEKTLKIPTAYVMGCIAMYWALGRSAAIFI